MQIQTACGRLHCRDPQHRTFNTFQRPDRLSGWAIAFLQKPPHYSMSPPKVILGFLLFCLAYFFERNLVSPLADCGIAEPINPISTGTRIAYCTTESQRSSSCNAQVLTRKVVTVNLSTGILRLIEYFGQIPAHGVAPNLLLVSED
jgi:hypothetical protein